MSPARRILIVNADDALLTPAVTEAILCCHDEGIVSSTTCLVNLPLDERALRGLKKRKHLGLGLHLNITLGRPLSPVRKVRSLVNAEHIFRRPDVQLEHRPKAQAVRIEYEAQIKRFQKLFGRLPTHIDTHHQLHADPFYASIFALVAQKYKLPVRRSAALDGFKAKHSQAKLKTTDYWFGNLSPERYWRPDVLDSVLRNLPTGVSEIMCHPGKNDAALRRISSFQEGRAAEFRLFRASELRKRLHEGGILLSHFGLCYTK